MGAYATAELHLVNGALLTGTWALALLVVGADRPAGPRRVPASGRRDHRRGLTRSQ
jgi:hypothetical protein